MPGPVFASGRYHMHNATVGCAAGRWPPKPTSVVLGIIRRGRVCTSKGVTIYPAASLAAARPRGSIFDSVTGAASQSFATGAAAVGVACSSSRSYLPVRQLQPSHRLQARIQRNAPRPSIETKALARPALSSSSCGAHASRQLSPASRFKSCSAPHWIHPRHDRRRSAGDRSGVDDGGARSRGGGVCRAGVLEGFSGVSNLMAPEFATVFSAIIAITSVSINLYGGLLTEKRRAELAREVERERQVMAAQEEERSVVARYRGPLLEATVDLEARLYHIATLTGEWRSGDVVCEEEVVYTLFTLAQWLGFLEVIRREGPRERSFLNRGGASGGGGEGGGGGSDTLTTLVEGFRFVLSAHPTTLRKWYEQGDEREHPGCRSRALMLRGTPAYLDEWPEAETNGNGNGGPWPPLQRPQPPPSSAGPAAPWPKMSAYGLPGGGGVAAGGGGCGGAAPFGTLRSGGPRVEATWYGGEHQVYNATPPPPTKPVVVYDALQGVGPGPGAGPGSELVIGSLDESDLAAAGLGLPDMSAEASDLAGPASPSASSPFSSGWDAGDAAAAAADYYGVSLSSLSSFDEDSSGTGGGGGGRLSAPRDVFHVSRGSQRSLGSLMVVTPMGASRHYTLSYGDFYNRYYLDDFFASWLRPVHKDILALVGGRRWTGQGPFPLNRWTRLLLLQQLLVEAIELLDPDHVRVPANRRVVLAPVPYQQAPELETYRARMSEMSQQDSPLLQQQRMLQGKPGGPLAPLLEWFRSASSGSASRPARTAVSGMSQQEQLQLYQQLQQQQQQLAEAMLRQQQQQPQQRSPAQYTPLAAAAVVMSTARGRSNEGGADSRAPLN